MSKDLGMADAYAFAVSKGYTGTREEFAELMASYADVADDARASKEAAETAQRASESARDTAQASAQTATTKASEASQSATQASQSASTATTKASEASQSAQSASTSAQTASTKASEASTSAQTAVTAKNDAVTAKNGAVTAKTDAETAKTGAETAAQSVSASASQIAANTSDIADLKEDLSDIENVLDIENMMPGYVSGLINETSGEISPNGSYSSASDYIPVTSGGSYKVTRKGSTNNFALFIGTYQSDKTFIARTYVTAVGGTYTLVAGENVSFIKLSAANTVFIEGLEVAPSNNRLDDIEAQIESNKEQAQDDLSALEAKHIRSNLSSDGIGSIPDCKVYKNGVQADSEFGNDDVRYEITLPDFDTLHLFFRYRYTAAVAYVSNSTKTPLFALGSGMSTSGDCNGYELFWETVQTSGDLKRNTYWCTAFRNGQTSYNAPSNGYKSRNGSPAIMVEYTGTVDSSTTATLTFSSGTVTYAVNGSTVGTVSYADTDTVQSLIDSLDALTDLSASAINTFGTCADLLLMDGETLNLVGTYTDSESATQYQAYKCTIPYALDDSWHTCEVVVDKTNRVFYAAYDGYTMSTIWGSSYSITNNVLSIGGNFSGSESPLRIRDLEIDVDNYGSAEIVSAPVCSAYPSDSFNQLISKHNPRLMILEGHGIIVGSETYAQTLTSADDVMAASTDRLNYIFDYLVSNGYEPVTMWDVIAWKLGKKDLPKRCFTVVFDDYRIANYVDYDKRKPFVKHNVKPALALITGQYALTDTVTFNGKSYTVEQALSMIKTAGWFPCSHTETHRRNFYYSQAELVDYFKEDVLSANDIDVNANVLVYPYGAVNADVRSALGLSDFALGINITGKMYNCFARDDGNLLRTEIGSRVSIENAIIPFV
jgi:peptidoglycan/xylan/chitin deacetylase (PgdA/CDA1 family)